MIPFIDCQGLAGQDTLGAARAGFQLVHRASLGAYGDEVLDANRHLLGDKWTQDDGNGSLEWEPQTAGLVMGTPPCSGFSLMNRSKVGPNARGANSAINDCMKELVRYSARCTGTDGKCGPEVVIFESVQQAYTQGRGLMQQLRDVLTSGTGQEYSLTNVLMSGSTVGAAQFRHRYFFVAHRIPFGVDPPEERRVATVWDAIADLRGLKDQWGPQEYVHPPTKFAADDQLRSHLVTAHATYMGVDEDLFIDLILPYWKSGEGSELPVTRFVRGGGALTGRSMKWWDEETDTFNIWGGGPKLLDWHKPGYVLTGNSLKQFIHPSEPRFLTAREGSRLMGLPDAWRWPIENGSRVCNMIGKCCPVQSARWVSEWARRALEGNPGQQGSTIGKCEYYVNYTNIYKKWTYGVEETVGG